MPIHFSTESQAQLYSSIRERSRLICGRAGNANSVELAAQRKLDEIWCCGIGANSVRKSGSTCPELEEDEVEVAARQYKRDDASQVERFPLGEEDQSAAQDIADLIRSTLSWLSPLNLRSAATAILALERMPCATPGVHLRFGFSTPRSDGNYSWVDIKLTEDEFRLAHGAHYYDPSAGGDTDTRTMFEAQAGSTFRSGNIEDWLEIARVIADDGQMNFEDDSDYNAVDWSPKAEADDAP